MIFKTLYHPKMYNDSINRVVKPIFWLLVIAIYTGTGLATENRSSHSSYMVREATMEPQLTPNNDLLTNALLTAVRQPYCSVAKVKNLLTGGANINGRDKNGNTPLMLAIRDGNSGWHRTPKKDSMHVTYLAPNKEYLPIIRYLVQEGKADVNAINNQQQSALCLAYENEKFRLKIAEILLSANMEVSIPQGQKQTWLHAAAQQGETSLVKRLVQSSPDELAPSAFVDAYEIATQKGNIETALYLLQQNLLPPKAKTRSGTPLAVSAAYTGSNILMRECLKRPEDVNMTDKEGNTPLHYAAALGFNLVVKELLQAKANVNLQNNEGETPLFLAVTNWEHNNMKYSNKPWPDYPAVVRLLLQAKANVNIQCRFYTPFETKKSTKYEGPTPLMVASQGGDINLVAMLLDAGAKINIADKEGNTAVLLAQKKGHLDIVYRLLTEGATLPNAEDFLFLYASNNGNLPEVKKLLASGVNVNMAQESYPKTTALMLAVKGGHLEVVDTLLKAGADPNATDEKGETALFYASTAEVVNLLVKVGANVNAKNNNGRTVLMESSTNPSLLQVLLDAGADVNAADNSGKTALSQAASYGQEQSISLLLQAGANVNAKDQNGETALFRAVNNSQTEAVSLLLKAGANPNILNQAGKRAKDFTNREDIRCLLEEAMK